MSVHDCEPLGGIDVPSTDLAELGAKLHIIEHIVPQFQTLIISSDIRVVFLVKILKIVIFFVRISNSTSYHEKSLNFF